MVVSPPYDHGSLVVIIMCYVQMCAICIHVVCVYIYIYIYIHTYMYVCFLQSPRSRENDVFSESELGSTSSEASIDPASAYSEAAVCPGRPAKPGMQPLFKI